MVCFEDLRDIQDIDETVVAMGNFDGMHAGHSELVRQAVAGGRRRGVKSAVFTFADHPKNVLAGNRFIKNIQTPAEKADILADMGIEYLFSIPFTETIHHMPPAVFIEELLRKTFRMTEVYCGFNHHFGYRAAGSAALLREIGQRDGFAVHVLEPLMVDGNVISSSLIRALIAEGRVDVCPRYMGRNYFANGEVVQGNRIGRTIGFPTLNILMDETMVTPGHGVYITCVRLGAAAYPAITNVGIRPTIGDEKKCIETHLFDFSGDLYGKLIRVEFLKKIRDERKFENLAQLSRQIAADSKIARAYHAQSGAAARALLPGASRRR
jgi:riboflavin kinase/FMN adenylyltransferase